MKNNTLLQKLNQRFPGTIVKIVSDTQYYLEKIRVMSSFLNGIVPYGADEEIDMDEFVSYIDTLDPRELIDIEFTNTVRVDVGGTRLKFDLCWQEFPLMSFYVDLVDEVLLGDKYLMLEKWLNMLVPSKIFTESIDVILNFREEYLFLEDSKYWPNVLAYKKPRRRLRIR